ncbi:hypothetical protein ACLB1N_09285 [Escherichia coli]
MASDSPGTDAALVAGIAWVLINENLVDQPFLDKYCVGYDEKTLPADAPKNGHYKAYILGEGDDKTAKTPQWASQITGIPVDRIIKLAREIGTTKPAYICQDGLGAATPGKRRADCTRYYYVTYFDGQCRHQRRK